MDVNIVLHLNFVISVHLDIISIRVGVTSNVLAILNPSTKDTTTTYWEPSVKVVQVITHQIAKYVGQIHAKNVITICTFGSKVP